MGKKRNEYLSIDDADSEVRQITAEEYINYEDAEAVKCHTVVASQTATRIQHEIL